MPRKKSQLKVTISTRIDPALKKRITAMAKASKDTSTLSEYVEKVLTEHASPSDQPAVDTAHH
jgi:hypothetical protein